jgi:flagellar capping protein FliD
VEGWYKIANFSKGKSVKMSEEFVNKMEFNMLKEEVNKIKKETEESSKLLLEIDKKIDIINEKIITADKIDDLKFNPMEKRLKKLEDDQSWLWKTVIGTIIGLAIKVFLDVSKIL